MPPKDSSEASTSSKEPAKEPLSTSNMAFDINAPAIQEMMKNAGKLAVQEYIAEHPKTSGPPGERGEPGERGPAGLDSSGKTQRMKPEEIGYFEPSADGEGDVVTSGKTVVYKNVYDFSDRVKDCIEQFSEQDVKTVVLTTLRGDALK